MLEDLAPARAFIGTPTEEGLSFEMLNTLLTMDRSQESFSRHPVLWQTVNTWEEEEKNNQKRLLVMTGDRLSQVFYKLR